MQIKSRPHLMTAEIIIADEKGNIEQRFEAKSFVQNFIRMLYCSMAETSMANTTDTSGVLRTMQAGNLINILLHTSVINDATQGIVLGTGTNAVTVSDTKLQTPIAHGVGAGQLSYAAGSWTSPVTSGSDRYYEAVRVITNNSGADITVNEIGLYFSANSFKFCMDRTLNSFVIANATAKTITYRIKVTV